MLPDNTVPFSKLDEKAQELLMAASAGRKQAYVPYSRFAVGAALRCRDEAQTIVAGCNVESCSYPVSICAERTALTKAVSEGKRHFTGLSVVAERVEGRLTSPCGMCRQMVLEFAQDCPVYISSPELDQVLVTTTSRLLPHAFAPPKSSLVLSACRSTTDDCQQ
ncbi:hypothetical protein TKK_0018182 [Trichogramma kaykai]|uniref:Cytidine deaminase n=1 Tax=Trichogramma kaykai TaxID=54128 RepID=A0ABD2W0S2_9HYME